MSTTPTVLTTDELEAELEVRPWLRPYLEVGDLDLEPATRRFQTAQVLAIETLKRAHVPIQLRVHRGPMLTTSFDGATYDPEKLRG